MEADLLTKKDAEFLTAVMGTELPQFRGQIINSTLILQAKLFIENQLLNYIASGEIENYETLRNLYDVTFEPVPGKLVITWYYEE